jgi:hypothetical protein
MPPLDFELGEVVRLRKAHPCGGTDWQVTRLGADIGLRCLICNRRILLERATLEKRLKQRLSAGGTPDPAKGPQAASLSLNHPSSKSASSHNG